MGRAKRAARLSERKSLFICVVFVEVGCFLVRGMRGCGGAGLWRRCDRGRRSGA